MIQGKVLLNDTFAECARVSFRKDKEGTDRIIIQDGIMYLYRWDSLVRIAKSFDIVFK